MAAMLELKIQKVTSALEIQLQKTRFKRFKNQTKDFINKYINK